MGNQLAAAMSRALSVPEPVTEETSPDFLRFPYEKLYKDGHVAVMYSPGYGAGWWTWNEQYPGLLFDADIAQAIEDDDRERIPELVESRYPGAYLGGLEDVVIHWVPIGARFEITEYDGSESIHLADEKRWFVA